ncbi:S1C family serine protease [Mangrovibacillus cuniculi]|uniref:PDZ domain-containing protein n=1 Tax=Mangrovibacillus cuniculi TaxID=2593652 RepID=A0A7S8HGE0_9BACI|nr:trypsin-like peptidase domain-containing protein [Mangrovibacillus cuniculi]QPC47899.1 PDZ domain-containing protein [Mangrovibacillus cuniculi]
MGYYDDHMQDPQRQNRKQKGNRGGTILASLTGAILGGFLVLISVPQLSNMGILPYDMDLQGSVTEEESAPDRNAIQGERVSFDVNTDVTEAVQKAEKAVVGVTSIQSGSGFWNNNMQQEAGTGSGVIYKKEGGKAFVVTNYHVIQGADAIEVSLSDGTKVQAKAVGEDPWTDLAVLEMDASQVKQVAEFGDAESLKTGEPVIAIGNPLGLQFSGSVTQGIISGLERTIPIDINQDGVQDWQADVIQTDAAINPGNSGGALVNMAGQVIGINSMKIAQSAVEGIGLAIPINYAEPIISDLEQFGEVKRPSIGVAIQDVSMVSEYHQTETLKLPKDVKTGVMVQQVVPNSPAELGGLREMDVIVELDGEKIDTVIDLRKHLYEKKKVGDALEVTFYRGGEKQTQTIKLTDESQL